MNNNKINMQTIVDSFRDYMDKTHRSESITISGEYYFSMGFDDIKVYRYIGVNLEEYAGDAEDILDEMDLIFESKTKEFKLNNLVVDGIPTSTGAFVINEIISFVEQICTGYNNHIDFFNLSMEELLINSMGVEVSE